MGKRKFTNTEIIEKTKFVLHSFYNRDIPAVLELMDDNCVWIGAYDAQYTHGKEAFIKATEAESQEVPIQFLQEEYGVIFHEGKYSAVYGRYTLAGEQEDGVILLAKVRLTFVWKQVEDELFAIHIHCADAKDIPLQYESTKMESLNENLGWFEYLRKVDTRDHQKERILIRDTNGLTHTLLPVEIIFVSSNDKDSTIYTGTDSFITKHPLRFIEEKAPFLHRIHRSYLVNTSYVKTIRRYTLTLHNGTELPISKQRYMDLKRRLSLNKNK